MKITNIPYQETGFYSSLICDYLDEKTNLKPFYNRTPTLKNFDSQIKEKEKIIILKIEPYLQMF
ncbi:MAG: bacillithiol biosynthesis BshC [Polaribacter sp.]|nr:bacillithiol biosynthesis BshC [Polaribacter sp.]